MQLSFQYEDNTILFDVDYSRRKTIVISVETSGKVSVAAPEGISDDELLTRVKSKAGWIIKKLCQIQDIQPVPLPKMFVSGESFLYLGNKYLLKIVIDNMIEKPEVGICEGIFTVITPTPDPETLKKSIEAWYRSQAQEYIQERITYYQTLLGVKPVRVKIKNQQKRWGSCSSLGNLNFNWRAVMAPEPVMDYLIVHELCHLVHPNHSKAFWHLVSAIIPDYKERRDWLKKNGGQLFI
ncbi:putative metal-dependent hydrolase [hydrocarbon metagenome]|uniref:Putative metal-dependent hydrolase n=1 Tax=hydrocarbon metagenome TaxID=938273 RepID=A0A0W8E519_9ZZZZ